MAIGLLSSLLSFSELPQRERECLCGTEVEAKCGALFKCNTAEMCDHAQLVNTDEPPSTVSEWTPP